MKKILILSFAAILALGFASCRKCTTCSRTSDGVSTGEVCNSKKKIEEMETKFQSAEYGYTCVRK
jgi:hypothetical protein